VSDVDAAKLPVMLNALRLPTIGRIWQDFGARADREGWGSARFLAAICDHELAERAARRIARHMAESGLPHGKTFATLDFAAGAQRGAFGFSCSRYQGETRYLPPGGLLRPRLRILLR